MQTSSSTSSIAPSPRYRPDSGAETPPAGPGVATFAIAVFLGSFLLFFIEPVAAKRVLPLLGGSAAVWAACLVFFQCALLLGYFAAHWIVTRLEPRRQAGAYIALLGLSAIQLAVATRLAPAADILHPVRSVLTLLALLVGIPFVTLSASGPLLQSWFARHGSASPYRLYVVSNVGSLLALVVYPSLVEPRAALRAQFVGLFAGMVVFAAVGSSIAALLRSSASTEPAFLPGEGRDSVATRVLWVSFAACASMLLSAVTSYVSQNVATIPLLWIVPLIAYLASFIIAFSDERWRPREAVTFLAAFGLSAIAYRLYRGDLHWSVPKTVSLHCSALFAICLFCHAEVHHRRPAAARLTSFYFHIAAGGALGAILVGIVAPMALHGNYELAIGLLFAGALGMVAVWDDGLFARVLAGCATAMMCGLVANQVYLDHADTVIQTRNFYGTLRVTDDTASDFHATTRTLQHGIIQHGQQVFRADLADQPTTYYGRETGVGLAVQLCCPDRPRRIGVIGLGTGTMAAYGRPGDVIRFYDINPAVEPIARRYFTYLRHSRGTTEVVTGDARVSLAAETPQRYDVIAVDAFSGDAIPVHLITSEALDLYRRHLSPDGVVAFHVSNRYLALAPVVQQLADHAGMTAVRIRTDDVDSTDVYSAEWVLVTKNESLIAALGLSAGRDTISVPRGLRRWTDDYNSLLPILKLR